jgi:hypothetical protein
MKHLHEKYDCDRFDLLSLAVSPKQARQIAETIQKEQLDVEWQCWGRLDAAWDRPIFAKAVQAGCRRISFGLESASSRVLQAMNKGVEVAQFYRIISDCHEEGIQVLLFLITGFPTEMAAEALETLEWIQQNDQWIDSVIHSFFTLDEKSLLAGACEKYGIQVRDNPDEDLHFVKEWIGTEGMSREEAESIYVTIGDRLAVRINGLYADWELNYTPAKARSQRKVVN